MIYEAFNTVVFDLVPRAARRILDLGCGSGELARRIKERQDSQVFGVTFSTQERDKAQESMDGVHCADLNLWQASEQETFDCVICSHVLEHLYQPQRLLQEILPAMTPEALLIVALPNILHWRQRLQFLRGHFRYTQGGLMDSTHFRFFDWDTAQELLTGAGLVLRHSEAYGNLPLPLIRPRLPEKLATQGDKWACRLAPGLFGAQFVFVCQKKKA